VSVKCSFEGSDHLARYHPLSSQRLASVTSPVLARTCASHYLHAPGVGLVSERVGQIRIRGVEGMLRYNIMCKTKSPGSSPGFKSKVQVCGL
jgi:hypothetical protein